MQVILREDIPNLGKTGDLVSCKDGFGRNYLIPRGLAVTATPRNMRQMSHQKRVISQMDARRRKDTQTLKEKIEALSLTIAKNVGEDEKLFGSVTNREIADALKNEGIEIDRKVITIDQPIKALGVYTISLKLSSDLSANLKVWVVAKE
jgi:large subunit ribosomal protein L9